MNITTVGIDLARNVFSAPGKTMLKPWQAAGTLCPVAARLSYRAAAGGLEGHDLITRSGQLAEAHVIAVVL